MKAAIVACSLLLLFVGRMFGQDTWTYAQYASAMQESGRNVGSLDERAYLALPERKAKMMDSIRTFLVRAFGAPDEAVMKAFAELPREYFMYNYETGKNDGAKAYEVPMQEWPIGYGSVLTDYQIQSYMTQVLHPTANDVCLEVGTGSGYQSALLSRIVKKVYTIEIISALGEKVHKIFGPLGYTNVESRVGDGFYGWPEVTGGFDLIIVTCQAPFVPPPLLEQLKPNGRMIIPVGQPWRQFLYLFTKDADGKVHSSKELAVSFIPMTGHIEKQP